MVRKSLLVLFFKTPSTICNLRFDTAFQLFYFVIIGCGGFRAKFRRYQELNPESQGYEKKLCFGAKKDMEFIIRGGRHKVHFSLCYHIKSRIEQANFMA